MYLSQKDALIGIGVRVLALRPFKPERFGEAKATPLLYELGNTHGLVMDGKFD